MDVTYLTSLEQRRHRAVQHESSAVVGSYVSSAPSLCTNGQIPVKTPPQAAHLVRLANLLVFNSLIHSFTSSLFCTKFAD